MSSTDIRFYFLVFARRLPYFLAVVAVVGAASLAAAYFLPPIYRASAKILVEQPQIPAELARSTVPTDALEQLEIIEQQITTRQNLLALAKELEIYGARRARLSEIDIVKDMRSRTAFELRGGEGARIFDVSFEAADPQLAARVVNDLTRLILMKNTRLRTDSAGDTMQFFEREVDRLASELSRVEAEILKFKRDNYNALPDSLDFRRTQQADLQERLQLLEREEASLRSRRNNLAQLTQAAGLLGTPGTPEQQMLQEMRRELADQLAIFSEDSPNIAALRTRINALQDEMRTRKATDKDLAATRPASQYEIELAEIDARLAYIGEEKTAITGELDELADSIAATAGNDTVLKAFDRNRENLQLQYNTAVARLADASTGERIEVNSKGERFSVVEPATPPQDPVKPNRIRIAGMGIVGGIAMGIGLLGLLEYFDGSVRRSADVVHVLQAKPLVMVPYIWADGERRARRMKLAGLLVLAACLAVLLVLVRLHGVPSLAPVIGPFITGWNQGWGI